MFDLIRWQVFNLQRVGLMAAALTDDGIDEPSVVREAMKYCFPLSSMICPIRPLTVRPISHTGTRSTSRSGCIWCLACRSASPCRPRIRPVCLVCACPDPVRGHAHRREVPSAA